MRARSRHIVLLLSGGLDSSVLLADLRQRGQRVTALGCHYGSRHNRRELACARRLCEALNVPFQTIRLDFIGACFASRLLKGGGELPRDFYDEATLRQTVVPFRNGILLAAAAGLAESVGAQAVALAAHGGDHALYPDCREAFLRSMGDAMRLGTYAHIRLQRPYVNRSKAWIVARGAALGVDFSRTWSCYAGGRRHCGACGTCRERREAFRRAGVADPTRYETDAHQ
jgi:7-cyano-7-deazaguanine synthase